MDNQRKEHTVDELTAENESLKAEADHTAIRIVSGDLKVEISSNVPSEKIAAIIGALKC